MPEGFRGASDTPGGIARPTRKLIDRVLDGSFRPDRHKPLVASEPLLPRAVPKGVDRDVWRALRLAQADFVDADTDRERRELAYEFADLADRVAAATKADLGLHDLLRVTLLAPEAKAGHLAEWEKTYGPSYRVRLGFDFEGEVDSFERSVEIPEPPDESLVAEWEGETAKAAKPKRKPRAKRASSQTAGKASSGSSLAA